jgi:hypothetical protein
MAFNLNFHKTIDSLLKIKLPQLTIFLAFISSFNLWFLSIYFFKHDLIVNDGYIITLLITLAFTTSWCIIIGMTVPKYMIWFFLINCPEVLEKEGTESSKSKLNFFVFAEIILINGIFIWLQFIFHWAFFIFITILFLFAGLQFLVFDSLVKSAFLKHMETKNENI